VSSMWFVAVRKRLTTWRVQFVTLWPDFALPRNPGFVPLRAKILPACRARVSG